MAVCFGEYLHSGLGKFLKRVLEQPSAKAHQMYQDGISLKEGEKRNLRDAFLRFKEDSVSGHTEATKELAECYLHGRGCEKDLIKASKFGDSKVKRKWRRKGE